MPSPRNGRRFQPGHGGRQVGTLHGGLVLSSHDAGVGIPVADAGWPMTVSLAENRSLSVADRFRIGPPASGARAAGEVLRDPRPVAAASEPWRDPVS